MTTVPPTFAVMVAAAGFPDGKNPLPTTVTEVVPVAGPEAGVGPEVTVSPFTMKFSVGVVHEPFEIANVTFEPSSSSA